MCTVHNERITFIENKVGSAVLGNIVDFIYFSELMVEFRSYSLYNPKFLTK